MAGPSEEKPVLKEYLPVYRPVGHYSGNPRNLEREFKELKEPDLDDPRAWLEEERNEPDFEKHYRSFIGDRLKKIDFQATEYHVCGQSHIDVAWKWRYFQTLRKTIVTYSKAAWHVKHHDDFTFAASQPLLLWWIMHEDPGLFSEIKEVVKTGRFDLVGGMWVEPDCHLPSGESFVRQRLYGQRFYLEHFGKLSKVEWVPDSFGFANTLPQIFLKSGSPYFMTTKLCGNKETPFPFVNFLWESPDGSRVLATITPGGWGGFTLANTFNPRRRLLKPGVHLVADYTVDRPEEMDVHSEEIAPACAFVGKGDGGHGPTGEEVAIVDKIVSEYPVKWITATDYFEKKLAPLKDRLPTWKDELYYEFHRGTITTQQIVKRMNRWCEWRLVATETLAVLAEMISGEPVPDLLERVSLAWKFTLLNQFHDVLPGSSSVEVYDDVYDIWERIKEIIEKVESNAWSLLHTHTGAGNEHEPGELNDAINMFNPTSFRLAGVPVEVPAGILDENTLGKATHARLDDVIVPVQAVAPDDEIMALDPLFVSRPRRLLMIMPFEPREIKRVELVESTIYAPSGIAVQDEPGTVSMENQFYKVTVNKETGDMTSILFKPENREILARPGIELKAFFDWLPDEPCWNIMPTYRTMEIEIPPPVSVEVVERGPVRCTIEVTREVLNEDSEARMNGKSLFRQRISILDGAPGIYLDFFVDWHTCESTVKLDIHTATDASEVIAETPYGTSKRSTRPVANHDKPRWENYFQSWVDMPAGDGGWGLAVLSNGNYGYDAVEGRLGLTLIRGPAYPNPAHEAWINEERAARKNSGKGEPPTHADQGTHLIQYVLVPHLGKWNESEPFIPALARFFNEGILMTAAAKTSGNVPIGDIFHLITVEPGNHVELAGLKRAEEGDGYVLRVVEISGAGVQGASLAIDGRAGISRIVECDLLERPLASVNIAVEETTGGSIKASFSMKPHEIKTFLATRA